MAYKACMRCGSLDLAMPGMGDGVSFEGGQLLASTCKRCGLTGAPVLFEERAAWEQFRAEREVLYKPEPADAFRALPPLEEAPARPRGAVARGIAGLLGLVFVLAAFFSFLTAAQAGGGTWMVLIPSGIVSLLLGLPMLAMARGRA